MPRTLLLLLVFLGPLPVRAADFIGPDNCKACHPAAWEAWKDSQHARASTSLSARQQKDARCLSCHAPDRSRGHDDVSCETCHGGGQYYSPRFVMKDAELARAVGLVDPSEKMCLRCHDASAPSLRPFDFKAKLKLIDHWTAEQEARDRKKKDEKKTDARDDKPKRTKAKSKDDSGE
jgi:hypothetical protein